MHALNLAGRARCALDHRVGIRAAQARLALDVLRSARQGLGRLIARYQADALGSRADPKLALRGRRCADYPDLSPSLDGCFGKTEYVQLRDEISRPSCSSRHHNLVALGRPHHPPHLNAGESPSHLQFLARQALMQTGRAIAEVLGKKLLDDRLKQSIGWLKK